MPLPPPPTSSFPLRRSREGGSGCGGGCPARPVGVTGRRVLRSFRASSSRAEPSVGRDRSPRGRRAEAAAARAARGRERGAPAAPPAPGPAGLLGRSRGHGGQREAEARGEAPEDAAGHDGAAAQPQVFRLRPARPHLREHDGRLVRVHLLLRQPVSADGGSGVPGRGGGARWECGQPRPWGLRMLLRFGPARVQPWGGQRGWGVGGVGVSERPACRSIPASRRAAGVAGPRGAQTGSSPGRAVRGLCATRSSAVGSPAFAQCHGTGGKGESRDAEAGDLPPVHSTQVTGACWGRAVGNVKRS